MMKAKAWIAGFLAVLLMAGGSLSAAVGKYDVNADGKTDICDLVHAKKESARYPKTYNASFLAMLRQYLLGIESASNPGESHSNGQGDIYLPEAP